MGISRGVTTPVGRDGRDQGETRSARAFSGGKLRNLKGIHTVKVGRRRREKLIRVDHVELFYYRRQEKKTLRKMVVQGEVLQGGGFLTGDAM